MSALHPGPRQWVFARVGTIFRGPLGDIGQIFGFGVDVNNLLDRFTR